MYDRIAFAAVGRYNEFESLRKAGVRYADMTGFQYDRRDVTARGLADWYAQLLGALFTDSNKPYEVEIVVAEVGKTADDDQIYRIIFDGSVAEEHGFVVMGGQADKVAAVLKERYVPGMSLTEAMGLAIAALAGQSDGSNSEPLTSGQLEAALLERSRTHRAFRRLTGAAARRAARGGQAQRRQRAAGRRPAARQQRLGRQRTARRRRRPAGGDGTGWRRAAAQVGDGSSS